MGNHCRSRLWTAIVITGAGLTGCHRDRALPGGPAMADLSVPADFAPPEDLVPPEDLRVPCRPDLHGLNFNKNLPPDARFDPRNGCEPGPDPMNDTCGDECFNCVPCFV